MREVYFVFVELRIRIPTKISAIAIEDIYGPSRQILGQRLDAYQRIIMYHLLEHKKLCIFATECIYMFVILTINSKFYLNNITWSVRVMETGLFPVQ